MCLAIGDDKKKKRPLLSQHLIVYRVVQIHLIVLQSSNSTFHRKSSGASVCMCMCVRVNIWSSFVCCT